MKNLDLPGFSFSFSLLSSLSPLGMADKWSWQETMEMWGPWNVIADLIWRSILRPGTVRTGTRELHGTGTQLLVGGVVVLGSQVRGEEQVQTRGHHHGLIILCDWRIVVVLRCVGNMILSGAGAVCWRVETAVTQLTLIRWTDGEGFQHHCFLWVQMT